VFCIECAKEIPDNAKFCSSCGFAQNQKSVTKKPLTNQEKVLQQLDNNSYFKGRGKSNIRELEGWQKKKDSDERQWWIVALVFLIISFYFYYYILTNPDSLISEILNRLVGQ